MQDLCWLTIAEAARRLAAGKLSSVELTRDCLQRIEALDPLLNSFITVTRDSAIREAEQADSETAHDSYRGPLHGIPIALKDIIDTAGVRTTAASAVFQDRIPEQDAEVVRRLRQAGAVIVGKTNLHEFAYGGSGYISHFGPARNPWDLGRVTGGSSSGSAAAVAAGLCLAAIGTDTAGSIRLPASCCGVVGLKPTYGLVSARGVIPLSWSYDHVGPIARSVEDCALVLQAIAGYDPQDPTSRELPIGDYLASLRGPVDSLRLGIAHPAFYSDLHPEVAGPLNEALGTLRGMVAEVQEVTLEIDQDRTVFLAESYAYHAPRLQRDAGLYHPETLRRIRAGENVSPADHARARERLQHMRRSAASLFRDVDALVTPTTPTVPPSFAELEARPDQLRPAELVMLRNTRPFNILGLPAISVPCGFTSAGLPIGLQIAAAPGREDLVLALAHACEQAAGWRLRRPPIGR